MYSVGQELACNYGKRQSILKTRVCNANGEVDQGRVLSDRRGLMTE